MLGGDRLKFPNGPDLADKHPFDDILVDLCSTQKEVIGDSLKGKLSKTKQLTPPKTNI